MRGGQHSWRRSPTHRCASGSAARARARGAADAGRPPGGAGRQAALGARPIWHRAAQHAVHERRHAGTAACSQLRAEAGRVAVRRRLEAAPPALSGGHTCGRRRRAPAAVLPAQAVTDPGDQVRNCTPGGQWGFSCGRVLGSYARRPIGARGCCGQEAACTAHRRRLPSRTPLHRRRIQAAPGNTAPRSRASAAHRQRPQPSLCRALQARPSPGESNQVVVGRRGCQGLPGSHDLQWDRSSIRLAFQPPRGRDACVDRTHGDRAWISMIGALASRLATAGPNQLCSI